MSFETHNKLIKILIIIILINSSIMIMANFYKNIKLKNKIKQTQGVKI